MIENIQPRRLVIGSITTSYTNAFINHSSVIDEDAAGKVFWTTISGYTESGHIVVPGVQLNFSKLTGLEPSSLYGISGAFFDAMADSELLEAKSGVSISDEFIVSTKTAPSITSIEQTSTQVDIGITDPRLTFTIGGDATSYILEYSLDLGTSWTPVSSTSNKISIPLPANDYTFRVSGVIVLPTSTEISDPIEYSEGVFTVEGGSSVPAAPTSLSASIGRIQTSFERFDVRLSWLWDRGTTGNIKEFIVKGYPTASVYSFTNPLVMTSAGTSLETVLIDIQKNLQMVFRVDALGYDDTLVSSETLTLTVTDDTVDTDYEEASGVEVTYAGIKAFTIDDNNVQTESFSLDAATGSVAIGYIDPQLGAPIRFDPVTGYVTVQGAVIANEIVSASFVMSQLTSSDRPSIRTTNKFNYADYNSGLYMGYNTDTGNPSFQFDMGSETEHIRWDGSNLYISGDVSIGTPGNATPLTQIGVDSTRYYNQEVVNFDGTFDEASAELYVLNLLVGSIIPVGSVVTQYDSVDYSKSKSAMWEDGGWTVPTVFINGSLMATQSITGDSINSNTILTGHIDARSLTFIDSATDSLPTEIDNSNAINTAAQDATEKADIAATTSNWDGVSGTGKPADNADVTNYLDDRVANSLSENGVLTVTRPKGGSFSAGVGSIGVIKITLPQSWTNTMMMFTVEVYEYASNKSFSLVLGGYNYSGGSWLNTTANLFGSAASDNRVRFGHDGTNCAIYIGNTNSNWEYPKISVKNFQAGYSNYSASWWDSGWDVSIETSVGTISKDISDSLIDAASIKNQGQLATREDVDFSTMVSGVTKPANNATANQSDDITNTPRTPVINQPINNFNGIFNSSSATSFLQELTGSPYIGVGVIVTQYDPDIITNSTSASWTGSAWDTAALMVNGNVLATGTVRGNSISSNTTVLAGSGSTVAGMNGLDDGSNTGPDGYRFWAGAQDPRDAPFSVTKEGEVRADRFLGQVSSAGAYQSSGGKRVNIYNTSEQTILSLTINRHREFEQRVSIGPVMFSITLQSSGNTGAFTNLDATVAFQLSNASPNSISLVYESTLYSSAAGITFNTYKSISPLPVDILEIDEGTGTATVSFSIYLLPNSGSTLNEPAAFSGNYKTTISNLVCNSWIADGYLTLTDY